MGYISSILEKSFEKSPVKPNHCPGCCGVYFYRYTTFGPWTCLDCRPPVSESRIAECRAWNPLVMSWEQIRPSAREKPRPSEIDEIFNSGKQARKCRWLLTENERHPDFSKGIYPKVPDVSPDAIKVKCEVPRYRNKK